MKISLNKLAEYNRCPKAGRRTKIIRDAKYPSSQNYAPYYGLIRIPVLNYIVSGDAAHLTNAINEIDARVSTDPDEFFYKDNKASKAAISSIKKIELPDFTRGGNYLKINTKKSNLTKEGVKITALPEILIYNKEGAVIGGIKMHYTKKPKIVDESMKDIGHLLHQVIAQDHAADPEKIRRSKCYCIDVSTQRILATPKAFVSREKDISQACADIATLWPSVARS